MPPVLKNPKPKIKSKGFLVGIVPMLNRSKSKGSLKKCILYPGLKEFQQMKLPKIQAYNKKTLRVQEKGTMHRITEKASDIETTRYRI